MSSVCKSQCKPILHTGKQPSLLSNSNSQSYILCQNLPCPEMQPFQTTQLVEATDEIRLLCSVLLK